VTTIPESVNSQEPYIPSAFPSIHTVSQRDPMISGVVVYIKSTSLFDSPDPRIKLVRFLLDPVCPSRSKSGI
jgi:hypothetical protein